MDGDLPGVSLLDRRRTDTNTNDIHHPTLSVCLSVGSMYLSVLGYVCGSSQLRKGLAGLTNGHLAHYGQSTSSA